MSTKDKAQEKTGFVSQVFSFFNQYNKVIYGIAIALLVIVCGLLAFNKFYLIPQSEKASALMTAPIELMMQGDTLSLQTALEGNDEDEGFLSIATSFKFTKTANVSNYYAGLCYLKLGDKELALQYLLKFKHNDDVFWFAAQGIISDLYDDNEDIKNAIKYCEKAAKSEDPYFAPTNLFKLGQLYEREGDWKKAASSYEKIEKDFFAQYQTMGVDKFLEKAKNNL